MNAKGMSTDGKTRYRKFTIITSRLEEKKIHLKK